MGHEQSRQVGLRHGFRLRLPRGSTEQLKAALEANGGTLVGADFFPFGMQDFGPAFSKIKSAAPDIVWFMFAGSDAITSVKQYRSFDMKPELIYHGWDEAFLPAVTPGEQAGIIASQAYFQQLDNPVNNAFVKRFADKYGATSPSTQSGRRRTRPPGSMPRLSPRRAARIRRRSYRRSARWSTKHRRAT